MGSGNTRKANDKPRINLPQGAFVGTGGGGSGARSGDINKICPPAFEVAITLAKPAPDGTDVVLKGDEMFVLGKFVGKMSAKQMKIITECAGDGIHYAGRVVNRKTGKAYAYFKQTAIR